jgi:hypothetical protein
MEYKGSTYSDKDFRFKFIACEVLSFPLTRPHTNGSHTGTQRALELSKGKVFELFTFVIFINRGQC